jgi:hypothetical protein
MKQKWGSGNVISSRMIERQYRRSQMLIPDLQIVNPKGEMKGSAITGPVGKEAAELWPVSLSTLLTFSPIKINL